MRAEVTAYAKINLLLDVLYRRADGYHEVEMVMQTIGLKDQLIIEEAKEYALYTESGAVPHDQTNLALKAALLLGERYQTPPVAVTLTKHIPVAAGLAGGSTDAAAVLLGMDKLFDLRLGDETLSALAAELGSDVPFCLFGPTALASGRGEKLTTLPECPKLWLVLVNPPSVCPRPAFIRQSGGGAIDRASRYQSLCASVSKAGYQKIIAAAEQCAGAEHLQAASGSSRGQAADAVSGRNTYPHVRQRTDGLQRFCRKGGGRGVL